METALVITAYVPSFPKEILSNVDFSTVICADAGYRIACENNIDSDFLIGDYDSMDVPKGKNTIILPCEKDITDTEAAINVAIEHGIKKILIIGGLGGRFDHTMGNVGMLSKYSSTEIDIAILDNQNFVKILSPGSYSVSEELFNIPCCLFKYMGIISYSDITENLTLSGVKYPLKNFSLENNTSLGVSNEIIENACISFSKGQILMILSNDSSGLK